MTLADSVTSVSGDILVDAGLDLTQAAAITSTSGDVGLIAVGSLDQASDGDVTTGGDVLLESGVDWMMAGDTVVTAGGNVVGQALGGDIELGVIRGTNVALMASDNILDANAGSLNVTADNLSLRADNGLIGNHDNASLTPDLNINAIDLDVAVLAAHSDSGIYLSEADGLTVTSVSEVVVDIESLVRVNFNSTTDDVSVDRNAAVLEDLRTTTDGPIKLVSESGVLTIEGGSDAQGLSAAGSGDVLLEARGADGDLIINADVVSDTGNITLDAGNDLALNASVTTGGLGSVYLVAVNDMTLADSVTSVSGDILVDVLHDFDQTGRIHSVAGDVGLVTGNHLVQGATSSVVSGGDLLLKAGGEWTMFGNATVTVGGSQLLGISGGTITLGRIMMNNDLQNHVVLEADADILDGNVGAANIEEMVSSANTIVALRAGGEIGSTNGVDALVNEQALDLAIDSLSAESAFGIYLKQMAAGGDLVIGQVAGQSIEIEGVVRSQFNGASESVPVESGLAVALEDLVTNVNGEIELVVEGGNLRFLDGVDGDGLDLKNDPEVVATGSMGRIDFRAVNGSAVIELEDNVQFHADKITAEYAEPVTGTMTIGSGPSLKARAIHLQSDSLVLGTDVELFTGVNQGTARVLAPRPAEYTIDDNGVTIPVSGVFPAESAFYDPSTVSTSQLTQVDPRNLLGTLSVNIGNSGERGLALEVDWGAPSQRYQQLSGLSGDLNISVGVNGVGQTGTPVVSPGTGDLSLDHYYTDLDLLFSRVNGRTAVTSPIVVRFAVRHHESIFVQAGLVQQDTSPVESIIGGVVSSTDNPASPPGSERGLESGHHRFNVPSTPDFSVPVLPQREVIPVIEIASLLPAVELSAVTVQLEITSANTTGFVSTARDEYFQLRVLRPDQSAEPYKVLRLADKIMTGDNLQQLQRSLPDGSYEIEYILGDTFSRVILRFDVRNGEPVIPEDALDEGELVLEEVSEQKEAQPLEGNRDRKAEQQSEDQDEETDDKAGRSIQPKGGVEPPLNLSLEHLGFSSWEPMTEAGVMIPISAVHPLGLVDDEISGDSLATGQVGEPVAEDEVDNVDRGPGQWQKEAKLETGLQFSLASVALATALHRRRQKLERKKLSRSARFAARRESVERLHDSETI